MKLYKFRSLATKKEKERVYNTLQTGEFHLSNWKELNDPMEGVFYYITSSDNLEIIENLKFDKLKQRICSFSKTFYNLLLWSHYADGHKGIAIEIEIDRKNPNLNKVIYESKIPTFQDLSSIQAIEILTKKIKKWNYEKEYRFIDEVEKYIIGEIRTVYFGIRCSENDKFEIKNLNHSYEYFDTDLDYEHNCIIKKDNTGFPHSRE
jgi:hypothetical protein